MGDVLGIQWCSTPFGITDYIGIAQIIVSSIAQKCSTPFGITESVVVGVQTLYEPLVFNAFGITVRWS